MTLKTIKLRSKNLDDAAPYAWFEYYLNKLLQISPWFETKFEAYEYYNKFI